MTLIEAEIFLKGKKLRFGDEEQIKAVKLLTAAEELTSLLKDYSLECPTCDGNGDVECSECNGKGVVKCDHCEDGNLQAPNKWMVDYDVYELLGKVQSRINEAIPLEAEIASKQEPFPLSA